MDIATTLFSVVAAFAAFILLIDVLGTTFAPDNPFRRRMIAAAILPLMMAYCLIHTLEIGGVIIDPRNVPLIMAVFIGGWPALLTTMLTGIAIRLGMGGPDTMVAVIAFVLVAGLSGAVYAVFRKHLRPLPIRFVLIWAVVGNLMIIPIFLFTSGGWAAMVQFMPQLMLVNIVGAVSVGLHLRYIQQRNLMVERLNIESSRKSRFLGVMGHEMRSPLNAILGYTYVVNEASSNEDIRNAMAKIRASSRHAIGTFENLLDSTRIDEGMITLRENIFSLPQFFDIITDQMRLALKQKHLAFHLDIDRKTPEFVRTDEFRLRQIIVNLLDNAIKYSARGDITLSVSIRESALIVTVMDTGMGIAEEDLSTIFIPYRQTEKAEEMRRAGIGGGAGLGLSIVDGLVRAFQGTLSVTSTPGRGTAFTIAIPVALPDAEELSQSAAWNDQRSARPRAVPDGTSSLDNSDPGTATAPIGPGARNRVLVVDDNDANRNVIKLYVEMGSHDCVAVENGAEALDHLERERFDLVLLDRHMPIMDGAAFAQAVREHPRRDIREIKLVLVSGQAEEHPDVASVMPLMDGYLYKPLDFSRLASIIDRYIAMDRADHQKGINAPNVLVLPRDAKPKSPS